MGAAPRCLHRVPMRGGRWGWNSHRAAQRPLQLARERGALRAREAIRMHAEAHRGFVWGVFFWGGACVCGANPFVKLRVG